MSKQKIVISCRDVWKLYGDEPVKFLSSRQTPPSFEEIQSAGYIPAVRGVSLEIARSEMLVVMGLSGSGKSTLVRCLSRLIEVTRGDMEIEGRNIGALNKRELIELRRNKMGMVFQNFALLPHRTVLDNVAFPLEIRGQDKRERRKKALDVIQLVGLAGREEYFPRELSGGQQQRVGIARSLVIEPDIWFLDEPFSALDPLIRREMQNEFLRLREMLDKTIVFITHDFDEALRLADRIVIMKDGAVQQADTPDKIVLHPANDYIAKFTEDIDKSRVVHIGALVEQDGAEGAAEGAAVAAAQTVYQAARKLLNDPREIIPVAAADGAIIGRMRRQAALDVLFGGDGV